MPSWLPPVLCIEAAGWAAFFAELGHRRLPDAGIARACGRIALFLLVAAFGFLLLAWGSRPSPLQHNEAARTLRTASVTPHAPSSRQALAHDPAHRVDALLARSGR